MHISFIFKMFHNSANSDRKRWQYWAVWTLADGMSLKIYEDYANSCLPFSGPTLSITHRAQG